MNNNLDSSYNIVQMDITKANIPNFINTLTGPFTHYIHQKLDIIEGNTNNRKFVVVPILDTSNSTNEPDNKRVQYSVIKVAQSIGADILAIYEVNNNFVAVHWEDISISQSNALVNQGVKVKLEKIKEAFCTQNTQFSHNDPTDMLFFCTIYPQKLIPSLLLY